MSHSIIFILSSIITILFACQTKPNNVCFMDSEGKYCKFDSLQINMSHLYIHPKSEIPPAKVTHVHLGGSEIPRQGSKIHTLTSEFCDAFPQLEDLNAGDLDLQRIFDDSFENCVNLRVLILNGNILEVFSVDILFKNKNLLYLDISDNLIASIDMKLFELLPKLIALDLSDNYLRAFDVGLVSTEVASFKGLVLRNNELTNLDEKGIVSKFTALKYLYLCPNQKMTVFRINQIVNYLEENGIETMRELCPISV